MPPQVVVDGDGIAATCCARLLQIRDADVSFQPDKERPVESRPVLLVNEQTKRLLYDVFNIGEPLFAGAVPIRRRVVLWGKAAEPQSFPHSGLAVSEGVLLERLWGEVRCGTVPEANPDWYIHSSRPSPARENHGFGSRLAVSARVELSDSANDACWVESAQDGWLFLIPTGQGSGSLLTVGASSDRLLGQSRLVAEQIRKWASTGSEFAAHPRISMPLCGPDWLACGSAAMAFDPICGEGAGHAVREAILASAVLRAIHNNANAKAVLGQYHLRLIAGFARHLDLCRKFYVSGRLGEWWDSEIQALDRGLEWVRSQLEEAPNPSSRLVGFDLQPGLPDQQ